MGQFTSTGYILSNYFVNSVITAPSQVQKTSMGRNFSSEAAILLKQCPPKMFIKIFQQMQINYLCIILH